MSLIPALEGQEQVDLCGFKANLVYIVSSRNSQSYTVRLYLKIKTNKQKNNQKV